MESKESVGAREPVYKLAVLALIWLSLILGGFAWVLMRGENEDSNPNPLIENQPKKR